MVDNTFIYRKRDHISPFILAASKKLKDVKIILDIGSRWGNDAINLKMMFPESKVYAFECTPHSINIWKWNVGNPDIILVEKAVCDYTGETIFYVNNPVLTKSVHPDGNQGANSILKYVPGVYSETYIQEEINVPCTTLQDWMVEFGIEKVDLIHIDVQGVELKVFKGMGDAIKQVRAIHTEVNFYPEAYEGMDMFNEVNNYLNSVGFTFISFEDGYPGRSQFANANYLRESL